MSRAADNGQGAGDPAAMPSITGEQCKSRGVLGWHRLLDWRPRSALSRVLIVFFLVAPIIVAGTMMWAMWDPSKYMRNIDLAVVNEDAGVDRQGKHTNYGDQVVEGLLDTDYLNFSEVNKDEGDEGLVKGKYLMVVTIPRNFSERAVTIISDKPEKPEINFATNDYYGTNGSVISSSLIPRVQTSVENAISKKYADQVIEGLTKLSDGLNKAADGAGRLDEGVGKLQEGGGRAIEGINKLDDGAGTLNNGTAELLNGTTRLNDGVGQLHEGAERLSDGAARLDDGASQLADGADRLLAGTGRLADGAGQIDAGVNQLTGMLIPVLRQAQAVVPSLTELVDILRGLGMTQQADQLHSLVSKLDPASSGNMVGQLEKLSAGTGQLHYNLSDPQSEYLGGLTRLNGGAHRLSDGIKELRGGVGKLNNGTAQLQDGASRLQDGSSRLHDGTGALKEGTGRLAEGGAELKGGMDRLKAGSGELSTKLAEGAAKAPTVSRPEDSAQNVAVPINFTASNVHPVQTVVNPADPTEKNITGGASMLFVLVFGFLVMLLLAMTLPYYMARRGARLNSPARSVFGAFFALTGLNFPVVAFLALMSSTLGWQPAGWAMIALVLAAISAVGAATYQFFLVTFGRRIGSIFAAGVFALGVMVFGGVWPVVAIPRALSLLHPFHPMSYAKDAFTRATDGIHDGTFWGAIIILFSITVVAVVGSYLVLRARHLGTAKMLDEHHALLRSPMPA